MKGFIIGGLLMLLLCLVVGAGPLVGFVGTALGTILTIIGGAAICLMLLVFAGGWAALVAGASIVTFLFPVLLPLFLAGLFLLLLVVCCGGRKSYA